MRKSGILLVNLGTPENPSEKEVKKFLKKFLSDQRVIKMSPFIWKPILHCFILSTRPKKSAKLYRSIYNNTGFPLLQYTLAQQKNVQEIFPEAEVAIGMSYSHPTIEESLTNLLEKGIDELTVVPMYPQYSGTTVGSVFDSIMTYFIGKDTIINLHFVHSFYKHPRYIHYFGHKIKKFIKDNPVDAILFSYHGIPVSYVQKGDKYPEECTDTTRSIMEQVGKVPFYQSYQSKFGPSSWLTPSTAQTLKELPEKGIRNILIVAPGFIVDCLETVEELEQENKEYFLASGGLNYHYIQPFNEDKDFAEIVKSLCR